MDPTPTRVAVVGAGPAGFFAAEALLKKQEPLAVDLFNRLPAPYGLVRDGVAPDHEPIKSVSRVYQKLLGRDEVRYFGNVTLGTDVSVEDLRDHYHQIVYAVGSQADRRLGIPGEDLAGSHSATEFVGWYNGHPDYAGSTFDLDCRHVVVIGNGNVAIDVARILVLSPERLATTDIADHALAALRGSRVREVTMLGRRGPGQASFTNPELKEFGELDGISVEVDPASLELDLVSQGLVEGDRVRTRNMDTLRRYAETPADPDDRLIRFRFLISPVEILGDHGRVSAVRAELNELVESENGSMRPRGTGRFERIDCGMVLRSVGYRCTPLPDVPFDEGRGIISNEGGRVTGLDGMPVPGEYVVGWAKRGPSGVIGTNKADAAATVTAMMEDREAGIATSPGPSKDDIGRLLDERGVPWIDKAGWARIEAFENERGAEQGRPRVKVCDVREMLRVAEG